MLLPSEIDKITDYINTHFVILEDELINSMAERISKTGYANIVVLNQANVLNQMGLLNNEVYKKVAIATEKSSVEIKQIMSEAMITSFKRDNIIFSKELIADKLKISESLMQKLQADISRLNFDLNNLTGTTAMTTQTQFLNAINQAHLEIISGAKSYTDAMINAINKVGSQGIDVLYPSGHKDKIEVATRRAIVTSVNQTNGQLQLLRCQELGWDLVEVSAHIGARPSHAVWQGQVYSLTGSNGYKNFYEETEYGDMLGLCGINCRHTFFPFYKGSTLTYNKKELDEINNKKVSFNGKVMSYYQATQLQRYLERNIRKCYRQIDGNKQLLINDKDIDKRQVKYSINTLQSKKNGYLNELRELEKQVGLKESNRLYTVGKEVKLYKIPKIEDTMFQNVKKNVIINNETIDILTDAEKKQIEKSIVYDILEGKSKDELEERTRNYIDDLTEKQKTSINRYTGNSFEDINNLLRGYKYKVSNIKEAQEHIDNIVEAFRNKSLGINAKLFRGVDELHFNNDEIIFNKNDLKNSEEWFKNKLVGKIYNDKAFQSTTINPNKQFKKNYAIEYNAPKDTKGMFINPISKFREEEFLIDRGYSAIIIDVKKMKDSSGNNYLKLYVDILPI